MSERGEKRKVEFIESYWTGGEYGSDYIWSDNHGELVRCKDCKYWSKEHDQNCMIKQGWFPVKPDWFCADGERRDEDD
jgi:hypothetical protein